MSLKQALHDRLWNAFQRWQAIRETGVEKRDLKMRGLREFSDPDRYLRPLIITGTTMRTYESILRRFIAAFPDAHRLEDLAKREFRAFIDAGIARGLSASSLRTQCSALSKLGALTGQSASFSALAKRYSARIRELVAAGQLRGPSRTTPSEPILGRQLQCLREWDARHFDRHDAPRAYHLARCLQWETCGRAISVTARMTADRLLDDNRVELIGKGGRRDTFELSPELHQLLRSWFAHNPGPLADHRGYRDAYRRAILAVGGRATGTHGARRAAVRAFFAGVYADLRASGLHPAAAADRAAGDAIERLGHSRDRRDHRHCYLGT